MSASSEIRRAHADDAALVHGLVRDAYEKYIPRIGMRPRPMDDDYAARIERDEVWLVGEVEAVLVLVPGDGYLLVDNVAVRPDVQGRGIGHRLLAFAEDRAIARGYRELRLYTNVKMTENRALYASLGYEEIEGEMLEGRTLVWMRKSLR